MVLLERADAGCSDDLGTHVVAFRERGSGRRVTYPSGAVAVVPEIEVFLIDREAWL